MRDYGDLIEREHPNPRLHPRMSRKARAAQFAPFAALVGYEDELRERRRTTEKERELDATRIEELNRCLQYILDRPDTTLAITYFVPDLRKTGGSYRTVRGGLKRLDEVAGILILHDGRKIPIAKITDIEVYENESTQ